MSHSSNRALGRDYVTLLLISRPLTVAVCVLVLQSERCFKPSLPLYMYAALVNTKDDKKRWQSWNTGIFKCGNSLLTLTMEIGRGWRLNEQLGGQADHQDMCIIILFIDSWKSLDLLSSWILIQKWMIAISWTGGAFVSEENCRNC